MKYICKNIYTLKQCLNQIKQTFYQPPNNNNVYNI